MAQQNTIPWVYYDPRLEGFVVVIPEGDGESEGGLWVATNFTRIQEEMGAVWANMAIQSFLFSYQRTLVENWH